MRGSRGTVGGFKTVGCKHDILPWGGLTVWNAKTNECMLSLQDLEGVLAELHGASKEKIDSKDEKNDSLARIRAKSMAASDALMLTDAPLLFSPAQLALAALRSGVRSVRTLCPPSLYLHDDRTAICYLIFYSMPFGNDSPHLEELRQAKKPQAG